MALFKKLTKKIVEDVKDTVKEETQKTTDEIVDEVKNKVYTALPEIAMFVCVSLLIYITKKPAPVVVKIVVKHV